MRGNAPRITIFSNDCCRITPLNGVRSEPGVSPLTLFKWIWGDKVPSDASKLRIEAETNRAVRAADWFEPAVGKPTVSPEPDRLAG